MEAGDAAEDAAKAAARAAEAEKERQGILCAFTSSKSFNLHDEKKQPRQLRKLVTLTLISIALRQLIFHLGIAFLGGISWSCSSHSEGFYKNPNDYCIRTIQNDCSDHVRLSLRLF